MRAGVLVALWACVPKGKHEITEVQLDATRTALSARTAQCAADAQGADARMAELQAEIATRQLQLDELAARERLHGTEVAKLDEERIRLLAELEALQARVAELEVELAKKSKSKKPAPPAPPPAPVETLAGRLVAEVAAEVEAHRHEQIEQERLAEARTAAELAFATLVREGRAELDVRGAALVVRFPTGLLFQEGFTTLSPRGQQVVAAAAEALKQVPGRHVTVEGHTDDAPVHSAEWPSNWERGFSRAVAVLRALEAAEAPARLSAASLAATRPLVPHESDAAHARNDRVELVIEVDPALAEAFAPTPPPEPEPTPDPELKPPE